jgi:hypothetical protein
VEIVVPNGKYRQYVAVQKSKIHASVANGSHPLDSPRRREAALQVGVPKKERTGPSMMAGPFPMLVQHLPLSYDRRGRGRSFSLADVLRTASDAQESEHCGHS